MKNIKFIAILFSVLSSLSGIKMSSSSSTSCITLINFLGSLHTVVEGKKTPLNQGRSKNQLLSRIEGTEVTIYNVGNKEIPHKKLPITSVNFYSKRESFTPNRSNHYKTGSGQSSFEFSTSEDKKINYALEYSWYGYLGTLDDEETIKKELNTIYNHLKDKKIPITGKNCFMDSKLSTGNKVFIAIIAFIIIAIIAFFLIKKGKSDSLEKPNKKPKKDRA